MRRIHVVLATLALATVVVPAARAHQGTAAVGHFEAFMSFDPPVPLAGPPAIGAYEFSMVTPIFMITLNGLWEAAPEDEPSDGTIGPLIPCTGGGIWSGTWPLLSFSGDMTCLPPGFEPLDIEWPLAEGLSLGGATRIIGTINDTDPPGLDTGPHDYRCALAMLPRTIDAADQTVTSALLLDHAVPSCHAA